MQFSTKNKPTDIMKWRKGEDYPDKEGKYIVRMSIGSMDRKVEVRESMLTRNGCRPHWQGAFDWNYVIEWLDESPTEIGQQGVEIEKLCKMAFREALQIDKPVDINHWWAEFKLQNNL